MGRGNDMGAAGLTGGGASEGITGHEVLVAHARAFDRERMIVAMKRYLGIALAVLIVSSMVGYRLAVRSGADGMKR